MSAHWMEWAMRQRTGSVTRKCVLTSLAMLADDFGRGTISCEALAAGAEVSQSILDAEMLALSAAGYVHVQGNDHGVIRYALRFC